MKSVDEYLSSIFRNSNDPETGKKLVRFVQSLVNGADIGRACSEAGLEREVAVRFLDSLKGALGAMTASTSPPRAGAPGKGLGGTVVAFADGASRGNPGEAACAAILYDGTGQELLRRSRRLGTATNNVAEYEGVILSMEIASMLGVSDLTIKLDSELVVNQLNGTYRVKNASLKPLHAKAKRLAESFARIEIVHVDRTETKEVDKLANAELDGKS